MIAAHLQGLHLGAGGEFVLGQVLQLIVIGHDLGQIDGIAKYTVEGSQLVAVYVDRLQAVHTGHIGRQTFQPIIMGHQEAQLPSIG